MSDSGDQTAVAVSQNHIAAVTDGLQPRESIIATAVTFLQNPNVQRSPLQQKQNFLRSKGLNEQEIQIACERAGCLSAENGGTVINMGISAPYVQSADYTLRQQKTTTFARIKDLVSSAALFGGLAYAIYWFYKKFIEPFLFGGKKKKSIEDTIIEGDKKLAEQITDLNHEIVLVREEITRSSRHESLSRDFNNFKNDLDAIKGLLLNRKQFANPLPIVPPSIPAWQLNSQQHSETEPDKNDDAGSGSGSSETEVVTKNSESSLEIM